MSHWAAYIKETLDKEMIEDTNGFATYYIVPGTQVCYIEDIYVAPEVRTSSIGSQYEAEIIKWAKERGCTEVMGSVNLAIKDPTRSMKVLLARGYALTTAAPNILYFKKNI